jgi:hypothetical protein
MKIGIYTWVGEGRDGSAELQGTVSLVDGRVVVDESITQLVAQATGFGPGTPQPSNPGAFLHDLLSVFDNAPYCWAEVATAG